MTLIPQTNTAAPMDPVETTSVTTEAPAPAVTPEITFSKFNLPPQLAQALADMKFANPTPIQAQAIPLALEGHDVLGTAQTGTGKTAAFGIPLVAKLLANPRGSALVLTPTRELAMQVITVVNQLLGRHSSIKSALLIGGDSMPKQLQQLRLRPRVIVGTPGRINDHLQRGSLMLHDANMLILDETDRMLDMGFGVQIDRILKFVPQQRQTMMFSATLPSQIIKLSEKYLKNPKRIAIGNANVVATQIDQQSIRVSHEGKFNELIKQLDGRTGSIIIFVKTKYGAEKLARKLSQQNHSADAIHGDLQQRRRERVIREFRESAFRILVATDIAARGLDIPHIEHVINYDLPQAPEDYIHRIGRTARAGAVGSAISFISSEDAGKWRAIERMLDPSAKNSSEERDYSRGGRAGGNRRRSGGGGGGYRGGANRPEGGPGGGNGGGKRRFYSKDRSRGEGNSSGGGERSSHSGGERNRSNQGGERRSGGQGGNGGNGGGGQRRDHRPKQAA